jgi:hypothetical protein
MQTRGQSRLEVSIDLALSLLVNIGGQFLFYGALATAGRSLSVAALVLGLAVPRRYATRRLFNALLSPDIRQPRWHSWLEVGVDTVFGLSVAIVLQWLFYGPAATWAKAGGLTGIIYAVTMCRRYILRRLFEMRSARQRKSPPLEKHMYLESSHAVQLHEAIPYVASQEPYDTTT